MSEQSPAADEVEGVFIPQKKAEEVAAIIFKAVQADVGVVRAEVAGIRSATTAIQDELALLANKGDMRNARSDVEALHAKVMRLEGRVLVSLGIIAGLLAALLVAALRYGTPGHS